MSEEIIFKFKSIKKLEEEKGKDWRNLSPSCIEPMLKYFKEEKVLSVEDSLKVFESTDRKAIFGFDFDDTCSYAKFYFEPATEETIMVLKEKEKKALELRGGLNIEILKNEDKYVKIKIINNKNYGNEIEINKSPTGNCQLFSISTMSQLLRNCISETQFYYCIGFIFDLSKKKSLLIDVTEDDFSRLKQYFNKFIFTQKYMSTRNSRMVMGILPSSEVEKKYKEFYLDKL